VPKFKIIISDPETGESKSFEAEGGRAVPLIGRKLGEAVDGSVVGMSGHKLQITGGSDKDGFPMRPNVHGGVRVNVIISEGVGFKPSQKGERQRKTLRGDVITEDIVQINMKIAEKPKKPEKKEKSPEADVTKKVSEEKPEGKPKETKEVKEKEKPKGKLAEEAPKNPK
jgi:small subunit ribosomal protein S6e